MPLSRRRFLMSQALGASSLAALSALSFPLRAAVEAEAQGGLRGSLVLGVAGAARADGAGGESGVIAFSVKDSTWRLVSPITGLFRVSPDGTRIAILELKTNTISLQDVAEGASRKLADLNGLPVWSPDGKSLIISALPAHDAHPRLVGQTYETWTLKLDGSPIARTPLPETDFVSDWSSDGSWLALRINQGEAQPGTQVFVSRPDGSERRRITSDPGYHTSARFSPDGKSLLYISQTREGSGVWVNSLDDKPPKRVLLEPIRYRYQVCWAPDGERIALTRFDTRENTSSVELVTVKTLERESLKVPAGMYNGCDWRG